MEVADSERGSDVCILWGGGQGEGYAGVRGQKRG